MLMRGAEGDAFGAPHTFLLTLAKGDEVVERVEKMPNGTLLFNVWRNMQTGVCQVIVVEMDNRLPLCALCKVTMLRSAGDTQCKKDGVELSFRLDNI